MVNPLSGLYFTAVYKQLQGWKHFGAVCVL